MTPAEVRNGKRNGHQTTTRLTLVPPAGHEAHRKEPVMNPNETNERAEKLHESAQYAQERAAATTPQAGRAAHVLGMVAGMRQMLAHLEPLAEGIAEAAHEQPNTVDTAEQRPERLQSARVPGRSHELGDRRNHRPYGRDRPRLALARG